LLAVDPRLDSLRADADADAIPLIGLELLLLARLIHRGVLRVNARQADHRAAPAADHQRTEGIADREGRGAEEVIAGDLLAFQGHFVIHLREIAPGVGDAGHDLPLLHEDRAVLDLHLARPEEVGRLPAGQSLAVEQFLPAGRLLAGLWWRG